MNIEYHRSQKKQGHWWIVSIDGFEVHRVSTVKPARRFAKNLHRTMARLGDKAVDAAAFLASTNITAEFDDIEAPYEDAFHSYHEPEPLESL
jgi:hypothetical protein